jgi:hypothetical protein
MRELMELLSPILTSTWIVRKDTLERTARFCEAFGGQGYEDAPMLLLFRELGEFVYVPERLTVYCVRKNDENRDKYAAGLRVFIALAKSRYGTKSRSLVRGARNMHWRFLLSKVAHQMDHAEHLAALSTLARIATLRPAHFLEPVFLRRLRLPKNTRRVVQLVTGARP